MRSFDLTPLYRSTIGFDRLAALISQLDGGEASAQTYPPYNIEKVSDNAYRITLAVAGFSESELTLETRETTLLVRGEKQANPQDEAPALLFQGIAARPFERRFQLADYVRVSGAVLENGLLHIDLVREVPEALKPRVIPITAHKTRETVEQIAA